MGFYINKENAGLNTGQNRVCVTRARCFGKTLAAQRIYACYDKSCGLRLPDPVRRDLEIARMEDFEKHLNGWNAAIMPFAG